MNVHEAIRARKSVRAFLDRPVEREKIERILDSARWAASGTNTQPWEVAVVGGEAKRALCGRLVAAFEAGEEGRMDYRYYPEVWDEPYLGRRRACGLALYSALGIDKRDTDRRRAQWAANYRAFDAPVALFFFIDPRMEKGSYMDYGMFLQSVMLAALEEGLATCPQAALGEQPAIVKEALGYPQDRVLVCGMALGYEDTAHPVNRYRTAREPVEQFTRFFD